MAKLVSEIGPDLSQEYARNAALRDQSETFLSDMRFVPEMTQKDVQIPYKPDEIKLLFQTDLRNKPYGEFNPPEEYNSHRVALFVKMQVAPSLGSEQMIQTHLQHITEKLDASKAELEATNPELQLRCDEGNKLLVGIETVVVFDKVIGDVKARMNQYHKG
jgi:hypothetical protein